MYKFEDLLKIRKKEGTNELYKRQDGKFVLWFPVNVIEGSSVEATLNDLFVKYYQLLEKNINGGELSDALNTEDLNAVKRDCETIQHVLSLYLLGDVIGAYKLFREMMDRCIDDFPIKEVEHNYKFYRMRRELGLTTKEEFYHLPTTMREKCSSERFSIAGYPCFYMGYSKNDCFEEISDTGSMIDFELRKDESIEEVLDLTYYEGQKNNEGLRKFLLTFPMIASCYVVMEDKKKEENAKFREEYIIPQMLTSYLKQKEKYNGICYYSVRNENLKPVEENPVDDFRNLALFPHFAKGSEYDMKLMNKFEWNEKPLLVVAKQSFEINLLKK